MIKLYLYCEGVTDFEPICIIIKKAFPNAQLDIERKTRNDLKAQTKVLTKRRGIYKHSTFIDRLAMVAKKDNCSHIAYHRDGDGDYQKVYESVVNNFSEHRENFHCLAIIPKQMIESWLLSDENAFLSAFGKIPENPALPEKPEELWGKKEVKISNYPKNVMERVLNQYNEKVDSKAYERIAGFSDINTLRSHCPLSFGRFLLNGSDFIKEE